MADAVIRIGGETILVTQRGAAGPRGLASGPLGAGSVDADTITDDGTEQALVRDKLGAASTADVAAVGVEISTVSNAVERAAAATPSSWPAARTFAFTKFAAGERVNELKTYGSPAAAINSGGALEVDNVWNDASKRVFLRDVTAAEGIVRFRIKKGPFFGFVLDPTTGHRKAIWSGTGANLEVGFIDASNNVYSVGTPNALAGSTGDDIFAEMLVGQVAAGSAMLGRSWSANGVRPGTPDVAGVFPSGVTGKEFNEGCVAFAAASGTAQFYGVEVIDGKGGAPVTGSASFEGSWFPVFEGGRVGMCTVRGGDYFRFKAQGTANVAIEYAGVTVVGGSANVPVIDVFVNGVRLLNAVALTDGATAGNHGLNLALGLDPAVTSNVEVRVRGVHEHNDKYVARAGLVINRVSAVTAGGSIAPWPDERPVMLAISDSTAETILARGTPSTPANSAGDVSWVRQSAEALGYKPVHNGFGGTGLLMAGSGGMPDARINARVFMKGRPVDFMVRNAKVVIFGHGVNDNGGGISTSTWQTEATAFVNQCFRDYPGLERFVFLPSFIGQYYKAQMQAVVAAFNDPRIVFCDTTGWGVTTVVPSDVHPDLASQTTIANNLTTFLRALPAPTYT